MNIRIQSVHVNSISNNGSLNIGKAILCRNTAASYAYQQRYTFDPQAAHSPKPLPPDAFDAETLGEQDVGEPDTEASASPAKEFGDISTGGIPSTPSAGSGTVPGQINLGDTTGSVGDVGDIGGTVDVGDAGDIGSVS